MEEQTEETPMVLLQIELCGGRLDIPGLVRCSVVVTLADACFAYSAASSCKVDVHKALRRLGQCLNDWSEPVARQLDLYEFYSIDQKVRTHLMPHAVGPRLSVLTNGADHHA